MAPKRKIAELQADVAESDRLHAEMFSVPASPVTPGDESAAPGSIIQEVPTGAVAESVATPDASIVQQAQPFTPTAEPFDAQAAFAAIERKHADELRARDDRMAALEAQLLAQREPAKPAEPVKPELPPAYVPRKFFTAEDAELFSDEMIPALRRLCQDVCEEVMAPLVDVVNKLPFDLMGKVSEQIASVVDPLKSDVSVAKETVNDVKYNRYCAAMDSAVPGWNTTTTDPHTQSGFTAAFEAFLLNRCPFLQSGTWYDVLTDAFSAFDVERSAQVYRYFFSQSGVVPAAQPSPVIPVAPAAPAARVTPAYPSPAALVAPGASRTSAPPPSAVIDAAPEAYPMSRYTKALTDYKAHRMSPDDFRAVADQYTKAYSEGRVDVSR